MAWVWSREKTYGELHVRDRGGFEGTYAVSYRPGYHGRAGSWATLTPAGWSVGVFDERADSEARCERHAGDRGLLAE